MTADPASDLPSHPPDLPVLRPFNPADALPASLVADEVARKPSGGKRKSDQQPYTTGVAVGRRANRDGDGWILVNAVDGANWLAYRSEFWDATQILAHHEVARMVWEEIAAELSRTEMTIGSGRYSKRKRLRLSAVRDEIAMLQRAYRLVSEAHSRSLVKGD